MAQQLVTEPTDIAWMTDMATIYGDYFRIGRNFYERHNGKWYVTVN